MKHIFLIVFFVSAFFTKAQKELDSLTLDTVFAFTSIEEALKWPDKVIKLELDKKKLKVFPPEIFKFKNLQYLDISKNSIKEIPDSLGLLPNLQYINASKNKIETMPNSIGKCLDLKWIIFNNNNINSLPHGLGNLDKLEYLDLWSNDLSFFPETLSKLKNLKVVDLRVILLNEEMQTKIKDLMPNATIFMDRACNCK